MFSFFKKIDRITLEKIAQWQRSKSYKNLISHLESLPENQAKWASFLLSFFSMLSPLLLLVIVGACHLNIRSTYKTMEAIDQKMDQIDRDSKEREWRSSSLVGKTPLGGRVEFQNMITALIAQKRVPPDSLRLEDVDEEEISKTIKKFSGVIVFKKLSVRLFTDFLKELTVKYNIKVEEFETVLDQQSKMEGRLRLLYFAPSKA